MYDLICKICGNSFSSSFKDVKICPACKDRPCEVCGKVFKRDWPYDQKVCSKECRQVLRKDKAKIAEIEARKRASVLAKYGVDNVAKLKDVRQKISSIKQTDEYKEKVKQTNLSRYGVENPMQNSEIKAKFVDNMKQKYGVDNASRLDHVRKLLSEHMKDPAVREHYEQLSMLHYGVPHPHMNPEVKQKTEQTMIERYGVPYYVMLPEYRSTQASNQISAINRLVAERIQAQCNLQTEYEFKIDLKLYDIHIINSNIVLEINPSYTHSDLPNHWCDGLPAEYHLRKSELAEANGYRCIHVFDWDNVDKIINMIQPIRERLYARKCKVSKINIADALMFIEQNHIQGKVNGTKFAYGLYFEDRLVEVMTFGKPRYNSKYEWELLRLCTKLGAAVIGGASKLFTAFVKEVDPKSIISYCDKAKFTGNVYAQIGMKLHHVSPPAKIWSKDEKYITDNLLRQRGYDQLFGTNYGKGTSNEELMITHGWRSVYDCGQAVYEWTKQ